MRFVFLFFIAVVFLSSCEQLENKHKRYVSGAVIATEHYLDGNFVQADTTGDGIADVRAKLVGNTGKIRFRGDSVSIDIRTIENFATPLLRRDTTEKSKQSERE